MDIYEVIETIDCLNNSEYDALLYLLTSFRNTKVYKDKARYMQEIVSLLESQARKHDTYRHSEE